MKKFSFSWYFISYLAKFRFSSYGPKCCWPINLLDSLKCNISRMKWMMKCIFGMQINIEVFYKLILSFWVCVARHAQSTENKKFAYLSNISRKTWGMKLILGKACPNWTSLLFLCNILRKKLEKKLIFCMQISMNVWASKFPTSWYYQY